MTDRPAARAGAAKGARAPRPPARPPLPDDPWERLDLPLADAGLPGGTALRRVGVRLGWERVRDLLFHLPRRYDDLRRLHPLGALRGVPEGTVVSAVATVTDVRVQQTWRRRVQVTTAFLEDASGTAEATWYGRRFIAGRLKPGDEVVVSGKVKHRGFSVTIDNPDFQHAGGGALLHAGRIVPVYRRPTGLSLVTLRRAMREALDTAGATFPEYLPDALRAAEELAPIPAAIEAAHFPADPGALTAALRRLAFDELLALQVGMVQRRRARGRAATLPVALPDADRARITGALEAALGERLGRRVSLTEDQARAVVELAGDLARPIPMLRLLQGDVGSGKTAVAAWMLAAAALEGRQGALLAPTDLLARQHAATVGDLVAGLGVPVTLLTGSLPAEARRRASEAIATGQAGIVVGTHALVQDAVAFADLALVVIDEQHRFGVEQRSALEAKARRGAPHVLLMTATPIPRTLGQVLYADLDVSTLRAAPAGRLPVLTGIRRPDALDRTWSLVRTEAAAGHRTFVVVPRIGPAAETGGEGDETEAAAPDDDPVAVEEAWAAEAEAERDRLTGLLAPLRVGLVHGRMRPADRDAEMALFRDGGLDVLVGTTVVEVGVDVPAATVMVIEGAERFGLAQLHQLRGRVGRGSAASYCVLVSDAAEGTTERARLDAVVGTTDGFALAERDFELRREGDVLGLSQSGLPRLRVATLADREHRELAVRARAAAEALVDDDGRLRPGHAALERELAAGWLARVHAGEPAGAA